MDMVDLHKDSPDPKPVPEELTPKDNDSQDKKPVPEEPTPEDKALISAMNKERVNNVEKEDVVRPTTKAKLEIKPSNKNPVKKKSKIGSSPRKKSILNVPVKGKISKPTLGVSNTGWDMKICKKFCKMRLRRLKWPGG